MLERAGQNVGHDFHVPVRVCGKAFSARYPVFVDDAQCAPVRLRRIVILIERECVIRIKPTVIEVTAVFRFANCDHERPADVSRANQELTTEGTGAITDLQIAWINLGMSKRVKTGTS